MDFLKIIITAIIFSLPALAGAQSEIDINSHLSLSGEELLKRARTFRDNNQTDSALLYYTLLMQKSLDKHTGLSRDDLLREAQAFIDMGNIYANVYHDYSKAYSCFRKAEEMAQKYGFDVELAECYTDLAVIYDIQSVTENTTIFTDTITALYKKGFARAMESKNPKTILAATRNMMLSALEWHKEPLMAEEMGQYLEWGGNNASEEAIFVKALCMIGKSTITNDASLYSEGMKILQAHSAFHPYYNMVCHDILADMAMRGNNPREAIAHLDSISKTASASDKWISMQVARRKAKCYETMGDRENADRYMLLYFHDKDTLLNQGNVRYVKDMHFMNQLDGINEQMKKVVVEREYQRKWLITVTVVALALALLLMMLIITHRKLRRTHAKLFEQSRQLILQEHDAGTSGSLLPAAGPTAAGPAEEEPGEISPANASLPLSLGQDDINQDDINEEMGAAAIENVQKYQGAKLTEPQKEYILSKIMECLKNGELICNPGFLLKNLAVAIGEGQRNVSQVVNEKCGCNFTTLLAEARIKIVCRRILESADYRRLTIEAIAEDAGIKSRSYFAATFKKFTGLNPSEYIRQANQSEMLSRKS